MRGIVSKARAAGWLAVGLIAVAAAARAGAADDPGAAGRHYAEAEAVVVYCPGGRKTAKADELAARFTGPARAAFDAEAAKVKDVWAQAMSCTEAEPDGRMNEHCRRVKRGFCGHAWTAIGPEGTALPGLIEFKP